MCLMESSVNESRGLKCRILKRSPGQRDSGRRVSLAIASIVLCGATLRGETLFAQSTYNIGDRSKSAVYRSWKAQQLARSRRRGWIGAQPAAWAPRAGRRYARPSTTFAPTAQYRNRIGQPMPQNAIWPSAPTVVGTSTIVPSPDPQFIHSKPAARLSGWTTVPSRNKVVPRENTSALPRRHEARRHWVRAPSAATVWQTRSENVRR